MEAYDQDSNLPSTYIIEKLGGRGMGITRVEGKITFVPFAVPGDCVRLEITGEKKSFCEARICEVVTPSSLRTEPLCRYFGSCGGCAHQNIRYEEQCRLKGELLKEILRHYHNESVCWEAVTPSPRIFKYRNKVHFQVQQQAGGLEAGFYQFRSRRIIPVKSCPLCSFELNRLKVAAVEVLNRLGLKGAAGARRPGHIKDIVLHESRGGGGLMLTFISPLARLPGEEELCREIKRLIPALEGIYLFHNPFPTDIAFKQPPGAGSKNPLRCLEGGALQETLLDTTFRISPPAFFQINKEQTEQILGRIRGLLEEKGPLSAGLLDLYAGMGTLSLPLADLFKQVLAVEVSPAAVEQGRENVRQNRIMNCDFQLGDAAAVLRQQQQTLGEELYRQYPCLILDPPRSGLSPELAELLAPGGFRMIYYLSCDPYTQARDLKRILEQGRYAVAGVIPFDMFPHTFHIENLVILKSLFKRPVNPCPYR